jgi:hypothetical protein
MRHNTINNYAKITATTHANAHAFCTRSVELGQYAAHGQRGVQMLYSKVVQSDLSLNSPNS